MKISEKLLRKYISGECTETEIRFIEHWMDSEEGILSDYSDKEVSEMKKATWEKLKVKHKLKSTFSEQDYVLATTKEANNNRVFSISTRIAKVAVAACFTAAIFSAGIFMDDLLTYPSQNEVTEVVYPEPENALYVSTSTGFSQKIKAEEYNISFEGLIQVFNTSNVEQRILCNGKEMLLGPNSFRHITSSVNQGYLDLTGKVDMRELEERFRKSKHTEVCLQG